MATKKTIADKSPSAWALARISLGLIFLWAFFDKLFGLGYATCRDATTDTVSLVCKKAWVEGGSPTAGFLGHATKGPLTDFYQGLVGQSWVDWLFMGGLLLIGIALVAGIAMRLAAISGSLLLLMMWSAVLPPANNPLLDDHIVYIIVLMGLALLPASQQKWSLQAWWAKQSLASQIPILK